MKVNVKFLALVFAVSLLICGCGPIRFVEPTKIYYVAHQVPAPIFHEKNNAVVVNKSFGNISESDKYNIYQFEYQRKISKQHDLIFSFVSANRETPYSPYYKPGNRDLAFSVNWRWWAVEMKPWHFNFLTGLNIGRLNFSDNYGSGEVNFNQYRWELMGGLGFSFASKYFFAHLMPNLKISGTFKSRARDSTGEYELMPAGFEEVEGGKYLYSAFFSPGTYLSSGFKIGRFSGGLKLDLNVGGSGLKVRGKRVVDVYDTPNVVDFSKDYRLESVSTWGFYLSFSF